MDRTRQVAEQFASAAEGVSSQLSESSLAFLNGLPSDPAALGALDLVLTASPSPLVDFHAFNSLGHVLLAQWSVTPPDGIAYWRSRIVEYLQAVETTASTRKQAQRTFAILVKRGWLELGTDERAALLASIYGLMQEPSGAGLGLELLHAVTTEFSCRRLSAVNLVWEFHTSCHRAFEGDALFDVFQVQLNMLLQIISAGALDEHIELVRRLLVCVADVCQWRFTDPLRPEVAQRAAESASAETVAFSPPASWGPLLLSSGLIDMMFFLLRALRALPAASAPVRSVLLSLASLRGPVLASDEQRGEFTLAMLSGLLPVLAEPLGADASSTRLLELTDLAQAVASLLAAGGAAMLMALPGIDMALASLQETTLNVIEGAASDEEDGSFFLEALDILLGIWAALLLRLGPRVRDAGPADDVSAEAALLGIVTGLTPRLVEAQVEMLFRRARRGLAGGMTEDIEAVSDQLATVAQLVRGALMHGLNVICAALEERGVAIAAAMGGWDGYGRLDRASEGLAGSLEELRWGLEILGAVLADEPRGSESVFVPAEVMALSLEYERAEADPVVYACSVGLGVLRLVCTAIERGASGGVEAVLPAEVLSGALRWGRRWGVCYALPPMAEYVAFSRSLERAFGADGSLIGDALNTLATLTAHALLHWPRGEVLDFVSAAATASLVRLSRSPALAAALATQPAMSALVIAWAERPAALRCLDSGHVTSLAHGLAEIALGSTEPAAAFEQLCVPLAGRLAELLAGPWSPVQLAYTLRSAVEPESAIREMHHCLCALSGIARVRRPAAAAAVFEFLSSFFVSIVEVVGTVFALMPKDTADPAPLLHDVISAGASVFIEYADAGLAYLPAEETSVLCMACTRLIAVLRAHWEADHVAAADPLSRSYGWLIEDLGLTIRLLRRIVFKDVLSFAEPGADASVPLVLLEGLHLVLPVLSDALLGYSEISGHLFHLTHDLLAYYPSLCASDLNTGELSTLVRTLFTGARLHTGDSVKLALDSLALLFGYHLSDTLDGGPGLGRHFSEHPALLDSCIEGLLVLAVTTVVDVDLVADGGARALLALLAASPDSGARAMAAVAAEQTRGHAADSAVRLQDALGRLLDGVSADLSRGNIKVFSGNLRAFAVHTREFLLLC